MEKLRRKIAAIKSGEKGDADESDASEAESDWYNSESESDEPVVSLRDGGGTVTTRRTADNMARDKVILRLARHGTQTVEVSITISAVDGVTQPAG